MKTKKVFYFLFLLITMFFTQNIYSQDSDIKLMFTAENNNLRVALDSIFIKNLSNGTDTMLYSPDTTLLLKFNVGISDYNLRNKNSIEVSQNYPNPFNAKTSINIYLQKIQKINIDVRDILGRKVASFEKTLLKGNHTFSFYPGNEKCYLFTVNGNGALASIKMLSTNNKNNDKCKIIYKGFDNAMAELKSAKAGNIFLYELEDEFQFIGYSKTNENIIGSNVIIDTLKENKDFVFKITEGIPCTEMPIVNYKGKIYHTVLIGNQCWMKENLNVGKFINGSENMLNNDTIEKYCYDNDEANCDTYGGLYQINEANQYTFHNLQGICPDGWHIPTDEEMKILEGFADSNFGIGSDEWDKNSVWSGFDVAKKLKATKGWFENGNGTDDFGFKALPGGCRTNNGDFTAVDIGVTFWSSTSEVYGKYGWTHAFRDIKNNLYRYYYQSDYIGFSVRCIKD